MNLFLRSEQNLPSVNVYIATIKMHVYEKDGDYNTIQPPESDHYFPVNSIGISISLPFLMIFTVVLSPLVNLPKASI